jgi:hypothetical protein
MQAMKISENLSAIMLPGTFNPGSLVRIDALSTRGMSKAADQESYRALEKEGCTEN